MEEPKNAEDHEEDELDDSVQGTQLPDVNEGSGDEFQLTQLPKNITIRCWSLLPIDKLLFLRPLLSGKTPLEAKNSEFVLVN